MTKVAGNACWTIRRSYFSNDARLPTVVIYAIRDGSLRKNSLVPKLSSPVVVICAVEFSLGGPLTDMARQAGTLRRQNDIGRPECVTKWKTRVATVQNARCKASQTD